MRCLCCSSARPYRRTRITSAARRSSWTGLRSNLVTSSRLRPAWRRATTRTAGTRTPRKTSPSPYPPRPVLKNRWSSGTRSGSAASRSSWRSSFRWAGGGALLCFRGPSEGVANHSLVVLGRGTARGREVDLVVLAPHPGAPLFYEAVHPLDGRPLFGVRTDVHDLRRPPFVEGFEPHPPQGGQSLLFLDGGERAFDTPFG